MLKLLAHGYGVFEPRYPVGHVVWPHFDLLYVHTGRLRLQLAAQSEILLFRDEGILIYPDTPFVPTALTLTVRISLQHFSFDSSKRHPNLILGALAELRCGYEVFKRPHSAEVRVEIARAMALATAPPDPRTQAVREAQLTLILGLLRNAPQSHDEMPSDAEDFHQILTWASRRFGVVSVAALARRAGYSVDRFREFRELFVKNLGLLPSKYLLNLRMNEARRQLRESRAPIKQIARDLGYSDIVAFHRTFTRESHFTPGVYRKQYTREFNYSLA